MKFKKFLSVLSLLGIFLVGISLAGCGDEKMNEIKSEKINLLSFEYNSKVVNAYEKIEITVMLDANYDNPYNYDDISLSAHIFTPSGKNIQVFGFVDFFIPENNLQSWDHSNTSFATLPVTNEVYKINFSYSEPGKYDVYIEIENSEDKMIKRIDSFEIADSEVNEDSMWSKGSIKMSESNPDYFEYADSGKDYVPIGYAIAWSWPRNLSEFKSNITYLSDNGGNFTRIWGNGIAQTLSLETKYSGAGLYHMNHIHSQDKIFEHLREKNVTVQYSFDTFTSLQPDLNWYGEWHNHPYNKVNGGFLDKPLDFFTDETAIRLFKNKIKYTIARWGWDTNLTMFELFNEIDGTAPFAGNQRIIANWAGQMCDYIKSLDYYKRPISISFANPAGFLSLNSLEQIDFVTTHYYGEHNFASATCRIVKFNLTQYEKPVLIGEFGPHAEDFEKGSDGLYLQEGLWSSIACGSMMSAQSWWWDNIIRSNNIAVQMKPLRKFVDSFDFSKEPLESVVAKSSTEKIDIYGRINKDKDRGFVWLHQWENGWKEMYIPGRNGVPVPAEENLTIEIDVSDGIYKVEFWNTWDTGNKTNLEKVVNVETSGGKLKIPVESIHFDTAISFIMN